MERLDLRDMYVIPDNYKPPMFSDLSTNSYYPNLNSIEYRYKPVDWDETNLHGFFEILIKNGNGTLVLATNNYTGRIWTGSIWGYHELSDVGVADKEVFKLRVESSITNMIFHSDDTLLLTTGSGDIQLWSTKSVVRNETGYNLYNIATKSEHIGMTYALDLLGSSNEKAITGSSTDNCIKLWNISSCDIVSEFTFRYAHADVVTGLSSKPFDSHLFVSCSRDRSISIWDTRNVRPVTDVHEGQYAYTTIKWFEKNGVEYLVAGDETGCIKVYDPRNLSTVTNTISVHNRPVVKIRENNGLMAVLTQSRVINVLDTETNYENVYTNSEAIDDVRDALWTGFRSFASIGWDSLVSKHSF